MTKNTLLVVFSMAIAPVSALAVDGVVLINQATVTAAGGFPYVISQPGSYKLSGNLSATAGKSAFQITTSNVTLDLNGFNISSLGPTGGIPDAATGIVIIGNVSNIAIRNGSMFGWSPAISLLTGSLLLVEDMSFEENFTIAGLTIGNGVAVLAFNSGSRSLLKRVITDGQLLVSCPSLISDSVANYIQGFGGGCVFANTAHN